MTLRKVLVFNTSLGLTLPPEYAEALGIQKGDYLELYLRDKETVVIKRHKPDTNPITKKDK